MSKEELVLYRQQLVLPKSMLTFHQPYGAYKSPEENPARMYLTELSEGSRPAMIAALNTVANILEPGATLDEIEWGKLTRDHLDILRAYLAQTKMVKDRTTGEERPFKASHINKILTAVRRTLGKAFDKGQMDVEAYQRAVRVKNLKGDTNGDKAGRMITVKEAIALFEACNDGKPAGARDAAILAVAYGAGLRRFEIASLLLVDYDPQLAKLNVRKGKGAKQRLVSLPTGTVDAINQWLTVRGDKPGPLFPHILKSGEITNRPVSGQAIADAIAKRAAQAGINEETEEGKEKMFKTHDLRRTYISNLLDSSGDLAAIKELAGHSDINTTARYDRRSIRAQEAAARTIHVPYQRPRTNTTAK